MGVVRFFANRKLKKGVVLWMGTKGVRKTLYVKGTPNRPSICVLEEGRPQGTRFPPHLQWMETKGARKGPCPAPHHTRPYYERTIRDSRYLAMLLRSKIATDQTESEKSQHLLER